jgi:DNA polymerase/3'-5' exonuclease PolX
MALVRKQQREILSSLYGIGPKQLRQISQKMRHLNLPVVSHEDKLRQILKDQRIYSQLPLATQADLTYNPLRDIPREIIQIMDQELHRLLPTTHFEIAGSYKRGKPISHDIDLVLAKNISRDHTLDEFINIVNNSKIIHIYPPYLRGSDRAAIIFNVRVPPELKKLFHGYPRWQLQSGPSINIKIDIFLTPENEYLYTSLFATGSGSFNVRMRATAKRKGLFLNQHGLYRKTFAADGTVLTTTQVPVKDEQELFSILGMTYKTPAERNK